jgi:hypothetical protein
MDTFFFIFSFADIDFCRTSSSYFSVKSGLFRSIQSFGLEHIGLAINSQRIFVTNNAGNVNVHAGKSAGALSNSIIHLRGIVDHVASDHSVSSSTSYFLNALANYRINGVSLIFCKFGRRSSGCYLIGAILEMAGICEGKLSCSTCSDFKDKVTNFYRICAGTSSAIRFFHRNTTRKQSSFRCISDISCGFRTCSPQISCNSFA